MFNFLKFTVTVIISNNIKNKAKTNYFYFNSMHVLSNTEREK